MYVLYAHCASDKVKEIPYSWSMELKPFVTYY